MDYEYSRSNPFAILQWLQEGGYSCVLFVNEQKKSAYVVDEDDDYGGRRVAIQAIRHMLDYNKIRAWRKHANGWIAYRPTDWVEAWFKEYPPQRMISRCQMRDAGCTDSRQSRLWQKSTASWKVSVRALRTALTQAESGIRKQT